MVEDAVKNEIDEDVWVEVKEQQDEARRYLGAIAENWDELKRYIGTTIFGEDEQEEF